MGSQAASEPRAAKVTMKNKHGLTAMLGTTPKPRKQGGCTGRRSNPALVPQTSEAVPTAAVPQHQTQNLKPKTRHLVVQTAIWPSQQVHHLSATAAVQLISRVASATPF